jgi:hypothetical protein|mmetsp:Transcript_35628/g.58160  ORF Transcript_35628/g.58160 Transcript_35628/m.58160 type:complete len:295 (-) Transcript_35628:245-1129(-)
MIAHSTLNAHHPLSLLQPATTAHKPLSLDVSLWQYIPYERGWYATRECCTTSDFLYPIRCGCRTLCQQAKKFSVCNEPQKKKLTRTPEKNTKGDAIRPSCTATRGALPATPPALPQPTNPKTQHSGLAALLTPMLQLHPIHAALPSARTHPRQGLSCPNMNESMKSFVAYTPPSLHTALFHGIDSPVLMHCDVAFLVTKNPLVLHFTLAMNDEHTHHRSISKTRNYWCRQQLANHKAAGPLNCSWQIRAAVAKCIGKTANRAYVVNFNVASSLLNSRGGLGGSRRHLRRAGSTL